MQYLRKIFQADMRTPTNKPIQARFSMNERVLCYEPDLTKARVVYDAKILKVDLPENKKNPTLRDFHYLVHFQGWSSTWDRYVTEEFLLKVTAENKELQKKLFKEAEAATAALRKKNRKKKRTSSEALNITIEDSNPSPSAPPPSKKPCIQPSPSGSSGKSGSSKGQDAVTDSKPVSPVPLSSRRQRLNSQEISEENQAPIKLPEELKTILERDFHQVTKDKTLCHLPAAINVAVVLEDYVRHYAAICLVNYEKQVTKNYYTANRKEISRELLAKAMTSINLCKEIADGLRIIFDFNLKPILLYGSHGELKQYHEIMKPGQVQKRPLSAFSTSKNIVISRRQSLDTMPVSSHSSTTSSQSASSATSGLALNPPAASPTSPQAIQVLRDLQEWRLLPDSLYEDDTKAPLESMIYGPIYLLRLFVKLPEIISKMEMPVKTKKLVIKYMDSVVDYMQRHQDIFIEEK